MNINENFQNMRGEIMEKVYMYILTDFKPQNVATYPRLLKLVKNKALTLSFHQLVRYANYLSLHIHEYQ